MKIQWPKTGSMWSLPIKENSSGPVFVEIISYRQKKISMTYDMHTHNPAKPIFMESSNDK